MIIGIDLHGTMLNEKWIVEKRLVMPLTDAIDRIKTFSEIGLCTGNDLTFVRKHVPEKIIERMDFFVLETGCVISDLKNEIIVVKEKKRIEACKELEKYVRGRLDIDFTARRIATSSFFTDNPKKLCEEIKSIIIEKKLDKHIFAVYSNVAVDVIPKNYNKFSGLKCIAKRRKIIGIADSMNDVHLLTDADYGFIPKNSSKELEKYLKNSGKDVVNIKNATLKRGQIIKASKKSTEGVIEVLNFLKEKLVAV